MLIIADKLPELVRLQTEAIKNIQIDKVTVWDGGSSKDGKSSTANFISGLYQSVPPLHEVFKMAGLDLPYYLGQEKARKILHKVPRLRWFPLRISQKHKKEVLHRAGLFCFGPFGLLAGRNLYFRT
jgi:hypothetical protein